ncbi:hypothetical protein TanjilG_05654 [Lupinus angustifolius]|uniref:Uncharacterized protein n=1 Tax=Lupinus angustifolius TaxID=3871 RepID=A0A4P1QSK2_LUPAN|nr:hypothetical protein TanjilG_05654 [Lupinus angustifolius]
MEMKNIACVVLFAAASISAAMAVDDKRAHAPTPGHKSDATALGSFIGASLLSFIGYLV